MKLLTEKEIEDMAIATSKQMYQEMPCSRLSDNEKSYQFKDGFHIGARNGYIEGAQEAQELLLESASEGFEEWYSEFYGTAWEAWQAAKLSQAKELEELRYYKEQWQSIAGKANLKNLVATAQKLQKENEELREDVLFLINNYYKGTDDAYRLMFEDSINEIKKKHNLSETPNSSKEGV